MLVFGFRDFTASDANCRSTGRGEGHLRATVVVQIGHPRSTDPTVRVNPFVRVSVSETPDVALQTNREKCLPKKVHKI